MTDGGKPDIPELRMDAKSAKLIEWNPGQTIHVLQPPFPLNALVAVALVVAVVFGVVSYFVVPIVADFANIQMGVHWNYVTIMFIPLVAMLLVVRYCRQQMPGREVIFDWNEGTVEWYTGRRHGTAAMSDVRDLELRTESGKSYDEGSSGRAYRGILQMTLAATTVVILESPWDDDAGDAERRLTGFATALANELKIPLRGHPEDRRDGKGDGIVGDRL